MGLEAGTYISDLVVTNPAATDEVSKGDDHLRLIKSVLKATFPNLNGAVAATDEQLSLLDAAGPTITMAANVTDFGSTIIKLTPKVWVLTLNMYSNGTVAANDAVSWASFSGGAPVGNAIAPLFYRNLGTAFALGSARVSFRHSAGTISVYPEIYNSVGTLITPASGHLLSAMVPLLFS